MFTKQDQVAVEKAKTPTGTLGLTAVLLSRLVLAMAAFAITSLVVTVPSAIPAAQRQLWLLGNYSWAYLPFTADLGALALVAWLLHREGSTLWGLLRAGRRSAGHEALTALWVTVAVVVVFAVATFIGLMATFPINLAIYHGAPPPINVPTAPPTWARWVGLLVAPLTVAVAEEVVYRGFALPRLERRWGTVAAVVIQAGFFSLQHLAFTFPTWHFWLPKLVATFLAGLFLGWLYTRQRRLLPLIVAHFVLDLVGLGLPLFFAR